MAIRNGSTYWIGIDLWLCTLYIVLPNAIPSTRAYVHCSIYGHRLENKMRSHSTRQNCTSTEKENFPYLHSLPRAWRSSQLERSHSMPAQSHMHIICLRSVVCRVPCVLALYSLKNIYKYKIHLWYLQCNSINITESIQRKICIIHMRIPRLHTTPHISVA